MGLVTVICFSNSGGHKVFYSSYRLFNANIDRQIDVTKRFSVYYMNHDLRDTLQNGWIKYGNSKKSMDI